MMKRPLNSGVARPWVSLNMAMTVDGKIATENRQVSSFGSRADHDQLYQLRARADAVMTGAGTIREQNADLNSGGPRYQRLRRQNHLQPENLRIVVSGSAQLDLGSRLFHESGGPLILLTTTRTPARLLNLLRKANVQVGQFGDREVDLKAALIWLREHWKVRRLHCEGGGELNDAMFQADLVDELHLTLCPLIFGGKLAPTIAEGKGFERLAEATQLEFVSVRQEGLELFLKLRRPAASTLGIRGVVNPKRRMNGPANHANHAK
jgi:riboflavin-specific deaminase-like protein